MPAEQRSQTTDLDAILAAVKMLRRGGGIVAVPAAGIDLLLETGVVARCRGCGVSWRVSRTQYSSLGWWSCPSGCRPPNDEP
jgi:hypothetical protein